MTDFPGQRKPDGLRQWMCVRRSAEEERVEGAGGSGEVIACLRDAAYECLRKDSARLFFVRGPMGSGLSTLLQEVRKSLFEGVPTVGGVEADGPVSLSRLKAGVKLLDAGTIPDPERCAKQIGDSQETKKCVIVFGNEEFLRATGKIPSGCFDLVPIRPGEADCRLWVEWVGRIERGMDDASIARLEKLYARVATTEPYQWVGWLSLLAELIKADAALISGSPLEIFHRAIELRFASKARDSVHETIAQLKERLLNQRLEISELVSDSANSGFRKLHLEIVRAMQVLESNGGEGCRFSMLLQANLPFDAIALLNAHLVNAVYDGTRPYERELSLIDRYCEFLRHDLVDEHDKENRKHRLYAQALMAECLRGLETRLLGREQFVATLQAIRDSLRDFQSRIEAFIKDGRPSGMNVAQLWDLSDTLHKVGSGHIETAIKNKSKPLYFAEFGPGDGKVVIGSGRLDERLLAPEKPLRPYRHVSVELPRVWIAKFLVTVGEYREFHELCKSEDGEGGAKFFHGPGLAWYRQDREFLRKIADDFDRTRRRCLACEEGVHDDNQGKGVGNYETRIRRRAMNGSSPEDRREGRVRQESRWTRIWESEPHHMHDFLPVVDVNWWEASAYCRWFTLRKLGSCGFDKNRYEARLLPDWMWEAARTLCDPPEDRHSGSVPFEQPKRFGGHVKGSDMRPGRVGHLCFPVHVGLFTPPGRGEGPYDMAGNVWEWTASATFAEIVRPGLLHPIFRLVGGWLGMEGAYGEGSVRTLWRQPRKEQVPLHPGRLGDGHPLRMRLLRGGSFMSLPHYAWGSCMRTCDPPYYSFQDVGFRIAVFEKQASN